MGGMAGDGGGGAPGVVSIAGGGGPAKEGLEPGFVRSKLIELAESVIATGDEVANDAALMEAGMDSLSATDFTGMVAREFKLGTSPSLVFDFPTIREMVNHL